MLNTILDWPNLCDAWERVADNRGAPGPDRVTVRRFARHWEANLRRLDERVRTNRYRPGKMRRVAIPKPGGGQRLLSVANINDRVLQRAALNVLDDRFERIFLPNSFGYRPGRSLRDAVASVLHWRNLKRTWVLDADIDDCFASLDHALLLQFLAEEIDDDRVMNLMRLWLRMGGEPTQARGAGRGIALGMPISPLFCNVTLHRMDAYLVRRRWNLVRYADDFVILCRTREQAERAQDAVAKILGDLKLQMEPTKTRITSFDEGFDYLGVHFEGIVYSFLWQGKRMSVIGTAPIWLWSRLPTGYE